MVRKAYDALPRTRLASHFPVALRYTAAYDPLVVVSTRLRLTRHPGPARYSAPADCRTTALSSTTRCWLNVATAALLYELL